jgi:integrase
VRNTADLSPVAPLPFHHASAQEWETFVQQYATSKKYQGALLLSRRQFIERYPSLEAWFAAPLVERVGRSDEECRQSVGHNDVLYKVCYHARHYLAFLALRGYARFDWEWLIAVRQFRPSSLFTCAAGDMGMTSLLDDAFHLGFAKPHTTSAFHWLVHRILMHIGVPDVEQITDAELQEFEQALDRFAERPDIDVLYGSVDEYRKRLKQRKISLHQLQVVLYHRGQVNREPQRVVNAPSRRVFVIHKPSMQEILARYLTARSLTDQPATVKKLDLAMRQFVDWIEQTYPEIETFAEVTREHILEYAEMLNTRLGVLTSQPLASSSKCQTLTKVAQFFREVSSWGWEDVPIRPLLLPGDLPKRPLRVPRYIPEPELERLMGAIRALDCPYQQAALLVARWSGARRGEIRRLEVDCLDSYPDGTPRLRIPAGKTYQERVIPIHEEAAAAIRTLQALYKGERGLIDRKTGIITRYLFMHRGRLFGARYLFESAIEKACQEAGLVTPDGKPTVTPHRFRHTVGTQLAQRGARLRTIQKILGHESAAMSLAYLGIADEDVRQDYQAVLGERATIAGPGAEMIRSGHLTQSEVTWLKDHYFQTELELGRCLRLPQEGPCECDLYLTCAKFVTTRAYAPRLRRRRRIEQELVEDAATHGWQREVERHQCTIHRLEQLLTDLGEPIEGLEASD